MGKRVDLTGKRFGRWTVVSESNLRDCNGNIMWNCKCDCGRQKTVSGNSLRKGCSTSCGCYNHDVITKFGGAVYKEKLHSVWASMKSRCNCESDKSYRNYGGRGITVCKEWEHDYHAFKAWALENGYKPGMWIDRVDNNKGYSPKNCAFKTPKEQQRNKRTNVKIVICKNKSCAECPICKKDMIKEMCMVRRTVMLGDASVESIEEMISKVEQWAKEHPVKTRQSEFLKMFQNAAIDEDDGILCINPFAIDVSIGCTSGKGCDDCYRKYWLTEVTDNGND